MTAVGDDEHAPVEAYGVIGNPETCALVAPNGSIDWFPYPRVESPSIFAAILDGGRGRRFLGIRLGDPVIPDGS